MEWIIKLALNILYFFLLSSNHLDFNFNFDFIILFLSKIDRFAK